MRPVRSLLLRAGALILSGALLTSICSVAYDELFHRVREVATTRRAMPPPFPILRTMADLMRPPGLLAKTTRVLDAVTATTGTCTAISVFGHRYINAQVWSVAGAVATVKIKAASDDSGAPWSTDATITDPSATGEYYFVARTFKVCLDVATYVSGTINGNIEYYND